MNLKCCFFIYKCDWMEEVKDNDVFHLHRD